ncbi:MAG: hypothetical protein IPM81_21280 [Saprospirales bacterium]|nr:hypothetical protein [Saprospirales bacterium]
MNKTAILWWPSSWRIAPAPLSVSAARNGWRQAKPTLLFGESAIQILSDELKANEISFQTYMTYKSVGKQVSIKGAPFAGTLKINEISREKVLEFKRKMVLSGKENMANQYVRYLKIIFTRVLKHHELSDLRKPFQNHEINVVKISEKESLTIDALFTLREALHNYGTWR